MRLHSVVPNIGDTWAAGNAARSCAMTGPVRAAPVLVKSRTGGAARRSRFDSVSSISPSEGTSGTTVTWCSCSVPSSRTWRSGEVSTTWAPAITERRIW